MTTRKRAVLNTSSLDFLKDLVADIPDPGDKDGAAGEDGEPAPKRKRAAATKKTEGKNGASKAKGAAKGAKKEDSDEPSSSRVAIPISSLVGPSGDDDDYDPKQEDDYDEDEKDVEMEQVAAPARAPVPAAPAPAPAAESRANKDEDDDYDAE